MKSILEKALVHLLNEETEKAQELMHQFVVERARAIHESLREGDEEMGEMELEEEFFTEADLDDAEDTVAGDLDVEGGEEGEETMDMDGAADMGGDEGMEEPAMDGEGGDLETKIDDIADEMSALQAEFDRIMAEFEAAVGDENGEMGDVADDADSDVDGGEVDGEVDLSMAEEPVDDEEFDDITESMVDELKHVGTPNSDGMGADGKKQVTTATKSPIAKDAKAAPIKIKDTPHTHFNLEPAPKTGKLKASSNTLNHAKDTQSSVPAAGPKKAELSKPVAGNTKSSLPIKKK